VSPQVATSFSTTRVGASGGVPRGERGTSPPPAYSERRACPNVHISPRSSFWVRSSGSVIHSKRSFPSDDKPHKSFKRNKIREWSLPSRRRAFREIAAVQWSQFVSVLFITLTYPETFPASGRPCKRHFQKFMQRWNRRFDKMVGLWKFEFQKRGAPHFHLWVGLDRPVSSRDLDELREWVSRAWFEVVDSGSEKHLDAGTQVDVCRFQNHAARYIKGYLRKDGAKEYQNVVPDGFAAVGRFWGFVGGLKPSWRVVDLEGSQFFLIKRMMRRYLQSRVRESARRNGLKPRRLRYGGAPVGMFVAFQSENAEGVLRDLYKWASIECEARKDVVKHGKQADSPSAQRATRAAGWDGTAFPFGWNLKREDQVEAPRRKASAGLPLREGDDRVPRGSVEQFFRRQRADISDCAGTFPWRSRGKTVQDGAAGPLYG